MSNRSLSQQTVDAAKGLAPWRTSLPWWVVLIEGAVLAVIGLLTVLNPAGANVNLALALTVGLVVAGLAQIWGILREKVPEKIDSAVAARAAIAVYAGVALLVLYFIEGVLTRVAGFGIFGTAALVYGLLALAQVLRTGGSSRRQALVEFILFTAVGLITLWGLVAGGETIVSAVRIIGWAFLIAGAALIGLAIWRWQKGDEADEMIESVTGTIEDTADSITSLGRKEQAAGTPTASDIAQAAEKRSGDGT